MWTSSARTAEILCAANGSAYPASHVPANYPTETFGSRAAIIHRVASAARRRGFTFRSWNSGSCLRRKRFSAARALWECIAREASRTRSTTTKDNVRKQCAKALKTDVCNMNAQDCTLRNVTAAPFSHRTNFLRSTTEFQVGIRLQILSNEGLGSRY